MTNHITRRLLVGIYALTTLISALLLFEVQPIISKFILPWFGGSPAVWTTCVVFFQALLFGGYAYAHLSVRYLRPSWQAGVHLMLLALSIFMLPITPDLSWRKSAASARLAHSLLADRFCRRAVLRSVGDWSLDAVVVLPLARWPESLSPLRIVESRLARSTVELSVLRRAALRRRSADLVVGRGICDLRRLVWVGRGMRRRVGKTTAACGSVERQNLGDAAPSWQRRARVAAHTSPGVDDVVGHDESCLPGRRRNAFSMGGL